MSKKLPYARIERWDAEHYIISYAPVEVQHGEDTCEEYTMTVIVAEVTKAALVDVLVRRHYSVSDEFGILRQRDTKPEEFAQYNAIVEAIKAEAAGVLNALGYDD